jgi:L-ascorbate metabolism protein UlaG (beta-lactamase superfamily)
MAQRGSTASGHVDPDEAVQIMEDLEAVRAVGIHWGIFQLTNEAWGEPPKLLFEALRRRGISPQVFPAVEPGQQYDEMFERTIVAKPPSDYIIKEE